MTDKVQKIREKVERLQKRAEHYFDISLTENDRQFWLGESNVLTLIGKYIDTMQEEPKECMYSKDNYTDEDRKALCDGCEEECIEKINEERKRDLSLWSLGDFENNFFEIIKPYKDSRNYKNLCIRLVVWRSELWRWIHWKKRKEEPVSEQNLSNVERTGKNWKEAVSEAAEDYSKSTLVGSPYIKKNAFKAGAQWQLNQIRKENEKNRD